ncbi:hypothetical protein GJ496_008243 [Pomphorhynchus laevis]|nr:hypothetical protein GJ496_008243 [Pomphorhynchus laevis]
MCGFYDTRAIHEFIAKVDKLDQLIDCLSTDLRSANLTSIIWNSSYTDIDDNSKSNNVDKQATVNVGNCDVGNQCITQVNNRHQKMSAGKGMLLIMQDIIRRALKRRLALWNQAEFSELSDEASYLQQQLNSNVQSGQQDWLKLYRKLMTKGKLRAATAVLEDVFAGTLKHVSLIDGVPVKEILMSLHPGAIQPYNIFKN